MLHKQNHFQADPYDTQIDEHDEPTEPMRRSDVTAFAATLPDGTRIQDIEAVPSPRSSTQPFPHQYVQTPLVVSTSPAPLPVTPNVYSYPPPTPVGGAGSRPSDEMLVQPENIKAPTHQRNVVKRLFPLAVGMCFVVVQLLLLIRFSLKLLNISAGVALIEAIYNVSNVFVQPFRLLLLQLSVSVLFTAEIYTLLAILCYGLISRILVRMLKFLLKTR